MQYNTFFLRDVKYFILSNPEVNPFEITNP